MAFWPCGEHRLEIWGLISALKSSSKGVSFWSACLGAAAGLSTALIPDTLTLVPLFAAVVLSPAGRRVERAILVTVIVMMLAQTQIQILRSLQFDLRWVAYGTLLLTGSRLLFSLEDLPPRSVLLVLGAFLALAGASSAYSISPSATAARWIALVLVALAVFGVAYRELSSSEKIERIVVGFVVLGFVGMAAGMLYGLLDDGAWMGNRFRGILGNPNTVGSVVGLLSPVAAWWFLHRDPRTGLLALLVFSSALFLSGSRAGILATLAGSGYVALSALLPAARRKVVLRHAGAGVLAFIGIVLALMYLVRPETFWIMGGRTEHWSAAAALISRRPFLGYGFGTEDRLFEWAGIKFEVAQGAYMHSTYIGLAAQLGLVGAALFAVPWVLFLAKEGRQQWKSPGPSSIHTALFGSMLSGAVVMMFETWALSPGNGQAFLFWVMFAALLRLRKRLFA